MAISLIESKKVDDKDSYISFKAIDVGQVYLPAILHNGTVITLSERLKTSKKMAYVFNAYKSEKVEAEELVVIVRNAEIRTI